LQEATEGGAITRDRGRIVGTGATMELLAKILSSTLGRPVLDRTGANGQYNFKLEWTEDAAGLKESDGRAELAATLPPADASGPSIFTAIQEQLGLKLESGKGPVEIIAIDRAERPSGN
jgi:uncharacterized protein (TIGR03435 family)